MVKGLPAGLTNDHNFYHLIQSYTQKSVTNKIKSVHHILCEDWMILEPTGSMSELSLPSSGMRHHVVW
jgi:hypothetical protein